MPTVVEQITSAKHLLASASEEKSAWVNGQVIDAVIATLQQLPLPYLTIKLRQAMTHLLDLPRGYLSESPELRKQASETLTKVRELLITAEDICSIDSGRLPEGPIPPKFRKRWGEFEELHGNERISIQTLEKSEITLPLEIEATRGSVASGTGLQQMLFSPQCIGYAARMHKPASRYTWDNQSLYAGHVFVEHTGTQTPPEATIIHTAMHPAANEERVYEELLRGVISDLPLRTCSHIRIAVRMRNFALLRALHQCAFDRRFPRAIVTDFFGDGNGSTEDAILMEFSRDRSRRTKLVELDDLAQPVRRPQEQ